MVYHYVIIRETHSSVTMLSHPSFCLNKDIILFSHHASDSPPILCTKDTNMPAEQKKESLMEKEHKQENPREDRKLG